MKPSVALEANRTAVRSAVARSKTANPRVFGSVLYGKDREGSDLDLLVDPLRGVTLFDLGGLQVELEEILGVAVDLITPGDLPLEFRHQVLAQARPVIAQHPALPWKSMKGMRNRVAHGYFDIDLDIVWETVRTALPTLVDQLTVLRSETSSDPSA